LHERKLGLAERLSRLRGPRRADAGDQVLEMDLVSVSFMKRVTLVK